MSFWDVVNPGIPFSTMKAVIPCAPASPSVLAYTTSVSATVPLVHHILVPLRRHEPSLARFLLTAHAPDQPVGQDISNAFSAIWNSRCVASRWHSSCSICPSSCGARACEPVLAAPSSAPPHISTATATRKMML